MKKSEFKSYIREEIISVLSEAGEQDLKTQQDLNKELEKTIELSKQLSEADPADIKAQQDLGKELDNTKSKVDALTKASQDSPLAEDEDEEPTAADLKKKDSVATTASKLQKLTAKMKDLAKAYKEAEGDKKEKIKDELKSLTAEKKKLERAL
jgi:hypothetical protein